jgi:hypothetical protein
MRGVAPRLNVDHTQLKRKIIHLLWDFQNALLSNQGDEMGGACSMCGRDYKMHTEFWSENLKGGNCSEDVSVDGDMKH